MTAKTATPDSIPEVVEQPGLMGKLKDRVKKTLVAMNEHCQEVENAKEVGERENTTKLGKDWVNRCCG